MAITVKHTKVSTVPDDTDTSLVRPSDWNADHALTGVIDVANGGTGAATLTGYVKGNGTSAMTAVATVPSTDITGLGTMSTQNANAVAITGGTINGTTIGATTATTGTFTTLTSTGGAVNGTIGATTPAAGTFTTLTSSGTATLANGSTTYVTVTGDASYPMIKATGGTNTPLVLSPLGTGALQAQKTDSTATGGNARGANAVDWQMVRTTASQVAQATNSVIGGGANNANGNSNSTIAGGTTNTISGGAGAFIGGGQSNYASGQFGAIVGGNGNGSSSNAGYYTFIGGGQSNTTTTSAAVTTQSGTMNATTAVTLSGSNASIKVGQYITGTSISSNTYVAAISGTSLTLSQVASGSSTSTLSFFTPHGIVVGGGNNQATGSYSFIGGGGDAGTAANRNIVSGDWSTVVGGNTNSVSGIKSCIGGGTSNAITSDNSVVCGGFGNTASGTVSAVLGGSSNLANGRASSAVGGVLGTTRSITGNTVFSANEFPVAASAGVSQAALLVIGVATTDATATALRSNTSAAGTTNQVILPNNSAYFFRGEVVSGVTGGGDTKGWTIEGVIKRGAGVGTTALVGTPTVTSLYADAGAATWAIAVTADTTNGGLRVTFTGQAATTIRTVCQIRTTEMTY